LEAAVDNILGFLNANEPTISAIVGLLTLVAAVWGVIQLAMLPLVSALQSAGSRDSPEADSRHFNLLSTLLNSGLDPLAELDEQIAGRTLNLALLVISGFSLAWLAATLFSPATVVLTIINFSVFILAVIAFNLQAAGKQGAARWLFLVDIAFYWATNIVVMGTMAGLEYFLAGLLIFPLLLFRRDENRQQYIAIGMMIGTLFLSLYLQSVVSYRVPAPEAFVTTGYYVNAVFLALSVCVALNFYNNAAANSFSELEDQKLKSDKLVRSILPDYIAERVARHETTVADWHREATVLFAAVYGFESLYQRVSAVQLVELLSQVFVDFDNLVTQHGIDKVNTLGTNYVAATGIDAADRAEHEQLAEVALGMRKTVSNLSAAVSHPFRLRIGICTGDVVSGVIGEARPSFDVWGETVELANSMRDAALDNTIVVNEAAFWRLRNAFELTELPGDKPGYLLKRKL
jgi:class 3 adenylate cyclase